MKMYDFNLPKDVLLFKVSELSKLTSISVVQLKLLLTERKIAGTKNGRDWLVPRDSIIQYLNVKYTG